MITISLNAITVVVETSVISDSLTVFFSVINGIFVAIYIIEFVLKVYSEPMNYWKSGYNLFDLVVLVVVVVDFILSILKLPQSSLNILKVIRVLRSVRILRFFSVIRGLRVLLIALLATFLTAIIPFLVLLVILLFVYAVMGHYLFGYSQDGDTEKWGTFGRAMLSLLTYVTADGWTLIQERLTAHGFKGSEVFTISFILLGHFLYTNLFIGIIIYNIHKATTEFDMTEKAKRQRFLQAKKSDITQRQHRDILHLIKRQIADNFTNFDEMTKEFQKTLRHHDFEYSIDLCTNKCWIDTFVASLSHLENTKYRIKQTHAELSKYLIKMKQNELKQYQLKLNTENN